MSLAKRNMFIAGIILLSLIVCSSATDTQDNTSACVAKLRKSYIAEEKSVLNAINAGDCWTLHYTNNFVAWNPVVGKFEESVTSGKLMATKKMRYTKTNNVEVYTDENSTYTINHTNKLILYTKTDKAAFFKEQPLFSAILHDSLFKEYKISSCNEVVIRKIKLIKYQIVPRVANQATFSSINVYIDPQTLFFKEIEAHMNMAKVREVKSYSLVMTGRSITKPDKNWNIVKNHVFAPDGTLVKKYKNFVFKDLTK